MDEWMNYSIIHPSIPLKYGTSPDRSKAIPFM